MNYPAASRLSDNVAAGSSPVEYFYLFNRVKGRVFKKNNNQTPSP